MWAGVGHHLEPRLVDDIQQVLGIDCKSMSCCQHLLLIVLLETRTEQTYTHRHSLYRLVQVCMNDEGDEECNINTMSLNVLTLAPPCDNMKKATVAESWYSWYSTK